MANLDALRDLVAPIVASLDAEIYDLEFNGGVLKITVSASGGIDLDTIGEITAQVSRQLDLDDPISSRYTLEVSSPGLERTLRTPAHWSSAVGEQVRVKLKSFVEGDRRVEGTLLRSNDERATLETASGQVDVEFDLIDRARTVFEWKPTPKPGQSGSKPTAKPTAKPAAKSGKPGSSAGAGAEAKKHHQTASGEPDHDQESENA
ncbi:MAG: ribosome maturation factor RimP [Microthrixaceae bacterium]|nr:ribosome maturation factor RimP [Microthrixaceae bacterium]